MANNYDEKLGALSAKLDELSEKAAAASNDAKAFCDLRKEALQDKISTAKGDVTAIQEKVRIAGEEEMGKIRGALLEARMTARARTEDRKEARDKRHMENYIDQEINYILDCYGSAALLIADARLSLLEVFEALHEYRERFGGEEE